MEFLSGLSFDYSVLLDFVVSPETSFPEFFQEYLKLTTAVEGEWERLRLVCAEHQLDPEDGDQSLLGDVEHMCTVCPSLLDHSRSDQTTADVQPRGVSSFQDDRLPEAKQSKRESSPDFLSATMEPSLLETDIDTDNTSEPAPLVYNYERSPGAGKQEGGGEVILHEPCLDRVMGCCIRLRYKLERLLSKALLPNPSLGEEIVHLLELMEDKYEK